MDVPIATLEQSRDRATELAFQYGPGLVAGYLVDTISLFNTVLSHPDRSRVVIPNRKIVGEILHNYGDIRQLDLAVGVAYDTDIGMALAAIDDVLRANGKVLTDPAPVIRVSALADSSVHISVMPWVAIAGYGDAGGELNRAILESLRARRIVIPFPQREVRLPGREAG